MKTRRRLFLSIISPGLIGSIFFPSMLVAADWKPELLPPKEGSFRSIQSTFEIRLPADVPAQVLPTLKLEVDNVDVTALAKINGRIMAFKPVQALTPGLHEIRLMEFSADGNILERGTWKIDIRKSRLFRESSYGGNIDLTGSYRVGDDGLPLPVPRELQGQGSMAFEGRAANEKWSTTAKVNTVYNSQAALNAKANEFDLADFLFTGDAGRTSFKLGHHPVGPNSMILADFNRRGASAEYRSADQRAKLTGFTMRSEPITGFRSGFGVSSEDHQTSGAIVVFNPLKSAPERLFISTTYVNSGGQDVGTTSLDPKGTGSTTGDAGGLSTSGQIHEGQAVGLVADGTTQNKRWRFRGEYARSEFDFNGINVASGKEDDDAYSLVAVYTPKERLIKTNPLTWNLGFEHRRIGQLFRTLTNPGLLSDRLSDRAFMSANYKGWALNATAGTESDNVDDDPLLPRVRQDLYSINTTFTPTTAEVAPTPEAKPGDPTPPSAPPKKFNLFDKPTYTLAFARTDQEMKKIPSGFSGTLTKNLHHVISGNASFTPGKWTWTAGHALTLSDDDSANILPANRNSFTNNITDLGFSVPINERVTIAPTLQYNLQDNSSTNVETKTASLGVAVTSIIIKDKLTGAMNVSYNNNDTSDNSGDTITKTVDATLTWTFITAKNNRPGVDWFLKGNWQDPGNALDSYQIFAGVHIGWPITSQ